jgi:threonine/homoserine/homoserine lactone efflux protein
MTIIPSLIGFILAAGLITVTPGLDTALVLRATASEGRRAGGWAAVGVGAGCLVWGAAVALGLGAVLAASSRLFAVIRLAGAAYLIWMGLRLILAKREGLAGPAAPAPQGRPFRRGLLTNLLNPKAGVFYISFLPQFVPMGVSFGPWCFLLAAIHVTLGLAWFSLLIGATHGVRRLLDRPGAVKTIDRVTGVVFLGFGADLALGRLR